MTNKMMLVNAHEDETRIAITDGGLLADLHMEHGHHERTMGNIYRGQVVKVNPAFQAAFVDYGEERNGFLALSDLNPQLFKGSGGDRRPRIQQLLKTGQTLMVQVIKESVRHKGATLTTNISIPGRYLVLTPDSDRSGVSRKIEDPKVRDRLKEVVAAASAEDNLGLIVRTAGISRSVQELHKDLDVLRKTWRQIGQDYKSGKKPGPLHAEPSSIVRMLRDYFTEEIDEVWVDSAEVFQEALAYMKLVLPRFQKRLKLYVGDRSIFSHYGVETQIESLGATKVPLRSGGSIVIESTEALVSIDVNSGRSNRDADIEDTALRTNLEAAKEVVRQLRLRNLGGLIVVDFIDMNSAKNRQKVEQAISDGLETDKARTSIGRISQFGLLELSRQRIAMEITQGVRRPCLHCAGTGFVPTANTGANNVLRQIREAAATGEFLEIHGTLPLEVANFLHNERRDSLHDLEQEFGLQVVLMVDPDMPLGQTVELKGKKEGKPLAPIQLQPPAVEARQEEEEEESSDARRRRRNRGGRGGRGREDDDSSDRGDNGVDNRSDDAADGRTDEPSAKAERVDSGDEEDQKGRRRGRRGRGSHKEETPREASSRPATPVNSADHLPTGVIYESQHTGEPDEADIERRRKKKAKSPFTAKAQEAKPGDTLYDSGAEVRLDVAAKPEKAAKAPAKKAAPKKAPAKSAATKKAAATKEAKVEVADVPAVEAEGAKATAKKAAAKKAAPKKAPAKKPAAKKATEDKAETKPAPKKPAAKKAVATKTADKKPAAKKAAAPKKATPKAAAKDA